MTICCGASHLSLWCLPLPHHAYLVPTRSLRAKIPPMQEYLPLVYVTSLQPDVAPRSSTLVPLTLSRVPLMSLSLKYLLKFFLSVSPTSFPRRRYLPRQPGTDPTYPPPGGTSFPAKLPFTSSSPRRPLPSMSESGLVSLGRRLDLALRRGSILWHSFPPHPTLFG